jgi:hypothetical protein
MMHEATHFVFLKLQGRIINVKPDFPIPGIPRDPVLIPYPQNRGFCALKLTHIQINIRGVLL